MAYRWCKQSRILFPKRVLASGSSKRGTAQLAAWPRAASPPSLSLTDLDVPPCHGIGSLGQRERVPDVQVGRHAHRRLDCKHEHEGEREG